MTTKKEKTTEEKIVDAYQRGDSIQGIARDFQVSVDEVLNLTNNQDIAHVVFVGDQIDDPGPHGTINSGKVYKQEFTTN